MVSVASKTKYYNRKLPVGSGLLCFASLGGGILIPLLPRPFCQVAAGCSCQWEALAGDVRWQERISHFSFPFLFLAVIRAVVAAVSACGLRAFCSRHMVQRWQQQCKICSGFMGSCGAAGDYNVPSSWFSAG